ncbi:MAG TPA: hypothetical protein VHC95_12830 [Opitutales bacterium]|nr:hypothetical protein [Opitutales bacterium]
MTRRLAIFWLGALLVLAGCSTMPLSTMWKMRSFGPDTLTQVKPEELRVKVSIPQGYELDFDQEKPTLDFAVTVDGRETRGKIEMMEESHQDVVKKAATARAPAVVNREYVMKFTPESQAKFATLQRLLKSAGKGTKISLQVGTHFAKVPDDLKDGTEISFTISLLLFPKDGYLVLFDDVRLRFVADKAGKAPAAAP